MSFFVGLVFVGIGLFVIPSIGLFGILWALIVLFITITNGLNAFSTKDVSLYEMDIEERLKKPDSLHNQGLITK